MRAKHKGLLTLFLALIVQISFAQSKTISGTVSDQDGLPLPGVNIVVQGTTNGTQTDFDGNYSIQADQGQVLVFTYIGQKEVRQTVGASNTINVQMTEDAEALEEVVVTALGIKREEKSLGYSVQGIQGEGMTEARESNISNALSGKIAGGVQVTGTSGSVGASSRVVLRGGNSSITGNNEPLYVVDGIPIDNRSFGDAGSGGGVDLPNGAADINPDDIESVSVLKGPNAAALYGLRAGNGVIVITTKRGTAGKKFGISVNTNVTFSNPPLLLPDYQNSYGQGGDPNYFEYVNGASGGVGDGVDESWGPALDAGLEFIQWDSQLTNNGNPTPWVSYPDNVKDFLNTGINISNNVSLTTDKIRLSIGNSEEQGMVPFTELKKFNVGLSGSMELGRLTASASLNYFNIDSDNLPTQGYNNENPFQGFIWSARQVNFSDLRDWRNFPLAPAGTAAAGTPPLNWNHNFQNNPYWILETNRNTFEKDRVVGALDFGFEVTDWATLSSLIGVDSYSQLETSRQAKGSNESPDGTYTEIQRRYEEINANLVLNISESITEDITFSVNLGGNHMNRKYHSTYGNLPALELPDLYNLSNLQTGSTAILSDPNQLYQIQNQQINSLFGYGQISYKNVFFIDFTARNDWASILPIENNSFFYPSISGSVVLSDILNTQGTALDFLKIRGGMVRSW